MRENQRLELKSRNYTTLAGSEFISATYAQKKYLGWKDKDILANREFMRKDKEMQWELVQIETNGPNWKEIAVASALGGGPAEGGGEAIGGGGGGIPAFGGGPAEIGGEGAGVGAPAEVAPEEPTAPPGEAAPAPVQ